MLTSNLSFLQHKLHEFIFGQHNYANILERAFSFYLRLTASADGHRTIGRFNPCFFAVATAMS